MCSNCYGKRQNLIRKQSIFPSTAFAWDDLPFSSRLTHRYRLPTIATNWKQNRTVKLFKNFKNVLHPHSQVCWGGLAVAASVLNMCVAILSFNIVDPYFKWCGKIERKKTWSRREVAAAFELSGGARVCVGGWILKWRRWKMENLWNLWMLFSDNNT